MTDANTDESQKTGWFQRLKAGLSRTATSLTDGIAAIVPKKRLDDATLEELEELLITADLGPSTAARLVAELRREKFGREVTSEEIRSTLADKAEEILRIVDKPLVIDPAVKPFVILMVGVNGTGKTTTIGKWARQFKDKGKTVMVAAGDTFRAAAVEQLKVWGQRAGVPVIAKDTGADAAALAYEALEQAKAEGVDILMIDTAGRLQNKSNLMAELEKIIRVMKKLDPKAPHKTILTLDATTGQNAYAQIEIFREIVQVNGVVVTKLDGSAKGGVLVGLADRCGIPVHAIGVGEGIDDLKPFRARDYARSLVGLEP